MRPPKAPPAAPRNDLFPLWPAVNAPETGTDDDEATTNATTRATSSSLATEILEPATTASPASPAGPGTTDKPDKPAAPAPSWPTASPRFRQSVRPSRPLKPQRRPGVGLPAVFVLALLAGFVSWVSAEPFWLSVGHGRGGTATVIDCTGKQLTARCRASFASYDGRLSARKVTVTALPDSARQAGATVPASMVSADGRIAYAGSDGGLYLRWTLGLAVILLCGFAIAWAAGAYRLVGRRSRTGALLTSLAAPLLLFVGMLIATW